MVSCVNGSSGLYAAALDASGDMILYARVDGAWSVRNLGDDLTDRLGGTNTAPRASWRRQLARHATTGAYTQAQGVVTDISPSDHHVRVSIRTADGATDVIDAAYVGFWRLVEAGALPVEERSAFRAELSTLAHSSSAAA